TWNQCVSMLALQVFVFQAEDGIRDFHVTGVQTCALPILVANQMILVVAFTFWHLAAAGHDKRVFVCVARYRITEGVKAGLGRREIGRASCRERASIAVAAEGGPGTRNQ